MRLELTALFRKLPEGGYMASIMEIPGAVTRGETLDEARANLMDAVRLLFETRRMKADEETEGMTLIREPLRFVSDDEPAAKPLLRT